MKRITDREAALFVSMLRERANEAYEMASGNWLADPSPDLSAELYAESDQMRRIANRLDPPTVDLPTAVARYKRTTISYYR